MGNLVFLVTNQAKYLKTQSALASIYPPIKGVFGSATYTTLPQGIKIKCEGAPRVKANLYYLNQSVSLQTVEKGFPLLLSNTSSSSKLSRHMEEWALNGRAACEVIVGDGQHVRCTCV